MVGVRHRERWLSRIPQKGTSYDAAAIGFGGRRQWQRDARDMLDVRAPPRVAEIGRKPIIPTTRLQG
jgi:hypothetical protein